MEIETKKSGSVWYLLGGFIAGAAAGVLLAPQRGIDTREDIGGYGRRGMKGLTSLINRLPFRVKAGAAVGAVKGGGKQAVSSARSSMKDFSRS